MVMLGKTQRDQFQSPRRATLSCEHCRVKKLKCDGAKPACKACLAKGKQCVPQTPTQQPRPTNRRIKELEEENHRLRQLLQEAQRGRQELGIVDNNLSAPGTQTSQESTQGQWIAGNSAELPRISPREAANSDTSPSLLAEAPQMNHASYHGPTSVLFDDLSRLDVKGPDEDPATSDAQNTRCMLVAESARQRQLEAVNFATGSLDFDGVDPSLGMQLLSIYWTRQPHSGLIVYRTVFMRDMACNGPYFSKLLLNAMYYSASKHCSSTAIRHETKDLDTAGWSFRQRFTEILRDQFDQSRITSIQALLIMSSSLFSRCDERSVSWLYAGSAFNMLIDMGIHVRRGTSRSMNPEELEVRRRVFWGAFLLDKLLCLYQGRHPNLRLTDSNIPLVFQDDYEELEHFNQISFCIPAAQPCVFPSYNISLLEHFCRLSIVMERIHSRVYSTSHSTQPSDNLPNEIKSLQLELEKWRQELPIQLDFLSYKAKLRPLPYNLAMLATYNLLVILVFRLLLSHSRPSSGPLENEALLTCCRAASEISRILRIHEKLYILGSETFVLCYAAHISATIHIHVLAHDGNHAGHREALLVCLGALDRNKAIYSAARRAREILTRLMTDMGVELDAGTFQTPAVGPQGIIDIQLERNEREIWTREDGNETSPDLSTLLEPQEELDFLDFDATVIMENLRGASGTSESWLNVSEQTMLWDVYGDEFPSTWDM